jgi:hypothetical protein
MHKFVLKLLSTPHYSIGLISLWLTAILFTNGCSLTETVENTTETITKTTRKIARDITFAGDGLKKVVTVVRFEDKLSQADESFQNKFYLDLVGYLKSGCDDLIVIGSEGKDHTGPISQLPKLVSGQVDNFAVAVMGRQLGVNAVISGNLVNIRPLDELEGILWLKDVRYSLEVLISTQVYDTQTATKIIDESFTQDVEIDEIDYAEIKRTNAQNFPKLNEAYDKIVVDMGERICEAVGEENWAGFVTAMDGEKFIISAGGLVGLKQGNVLEVFDSGRILEGVDGQRFYRPGYKTAELEIVAISDNQAEAVKINGRGLKVGSVVRKK